MKIKLYDSASLQHLGLIGTDEVLGRSHIYPEMGEISRCYLTISSSCLVRVPKTETILLDFKKIKHNNL